MSLMMKRNSVRQYTDALVSDEHITAMLTSAMQAPSACNQQPWEFVVVKNRETLDKLSVISTGAWMLAQAPLCISVIIKETGKAPLMAQQDCAAATENILLEAVNLGLGAVWIGVYPIEDRYHKVNEILNVQEGNIFCNIAIGHPKSETSIAVRYDKSKIHFEKV
jgi:nitroreductase